MDGCGRSGNRDLSAVRALARAERRGGAGDLTQKDIAREPAGGAHVIRATRGARSTRSTLARRSPRFIGAEIPIPNK